MSSTAEALTTNGAVPIRGERFDPRQRFGNMPPELKLELLKALAVARMKESADEDKYALLKRVIENNPTYFQGYASELVNLGSMLQNVGMSADVPSLIRNLNLALGIADDEATIQRLTQEISQSIAGTPEQALQFADVSELITGAPNVELLAVQNVVVSALRDLPATEPIRIPGLYQVEVNFLNQLLISRLHGRQVFVRSGSNGLAELYISGQNSQAIPEGFNPAEAIPEASIQWNEAQTLASNALAQVQAAQTEKGAEKYKLAKGIGRWVAKALPSMAIGSIPVVGAPANAILSLKSKMEAYGKYNTMIPTTDGSFDWNGYVDQVRTFDGILTVRRVNLSDEALQSSPQIFWERQRALVNAGFSYDNRITRSMDLFVDGQKPNAKLFNKSILLLLGNADMYADLRNGIPSLPDFASLTNGNSANLQLNEQQLFNLYTALIAASQDQNLAKGLSNVLGQDAVNAIAGLRLKPWDDSFTGRLNKDLSLLLNIIDTGKSLNSTALKMTMTAGVRAWGSFTGLAAVEVAAGMIDAIVRVNDRVEQRVNRVELTQADVDVSTIRGQETRKALTGYIAGMASYGLASMTAPALTKGLQALGLEEIPRNTLDLTSRWIGRAVSMMTAGSIYALANSRKDRAVLMQDMLRNLSYMISGQGFASAMDSVQAQFSHERLSSAFAKWAGISFQGNPLAAHVAVENLGVGNPNEILGSVNEVASASYWMPGPARVFEYLDENGNLKVGNDLMEFVKHINVPQEGLNVMIDGQNVHLNGGENLFSELDQLPQFNSSANKSRFVETILDAIDDSSPEGANKHGFNATAHASLDAYLGAHPELISDDVQPTVTEPQGPEGAKSRVSDRPERQPLPKQEGLPPIPDQDQSGVEGVVQASVFGIQRNLVPTADNSSMFTEPGLNLLLGGGLVGNIVYSRSSSGEMIPASLEINGTPYTISSDSARNFDDQNGVVTFNYKDGNRIALYFEGGQLKYPKLVSADGTIIANDLSGAPETIVQAPAAEPVQTTLPVVPEITTEPAVPTVSESVNSTGVITTAKIFGADNQQVENLGNGIYARPDAGMRTIYFDGGKPGFVYFNAAGDAIGVIVEGKQVPFAFPVMNQDGRGSVVIDGSEHYVQFKNGFVDTVADKDSITFDNKEIATDEAVVMANLPGTVGTNVPATQMPTTPAAEAFIQPEATSSTELIANTFTLDEAKFKAWPSSYGEREDLGASLRIVLEELKSDPAAFRAKYGIEGEITAETMVEVGAAHMINKNNGGPELNATSFQALMDGRPDVFKYNYGGGEGVAYRGAINALVEGGPITTQTSAANLPQGTVITPESAVIVPENVVAGQVAADGNGGFYVEQDGVRYNATKVEPQLPADDRYQITGYSTVGQGTLVEGIKDVDPSAAGMQLYAVNLSSTQLPYFTPQGQLVYTAKVFYDGNMNIVGFEIDSGIPPQKLAFWHTGQVGPLQEGFRLLDPRTKLLDQNVTIPTNSATSMTWENIRDAALAKIYEDQNSSQQSALNSLPDWLFPDKQDREVEIDWLINDAKLLFHRDNGGVDIILSDGRTVSGGRIINLEGEYLLEINRNAGSISNSDIVIVPISATALSQGVKEEIIGSMLSLIPGEGESANADPIKIYLIRGQYYFENGGVLDKVDNPAEQAELDNALDKYNVIRYRSDSGLDLLSWNRDSEWTQTNQRIELPGFGMVTINPSRGQMHTTGANNSDITWELVNVNNIPDSLQGKFKINDLLDSEEGTQLFMGRAALPSSGGQTQYVTFYSNGGEIVGFQVPTTNASGIVEQTSFWLDDFNSSSDAVFVNSSGNSISDDALLTFDDPVSFIAATTATNLGLSIEFTPPDNYQVQVPDGLDVSNPSITLILNDAVSINISSMSSGDEIISSAPQGANWVEKMQVRVDGIKLSEYFPPLFDSQAIANMDAELNIAGNHVFRVHPQTNQIIPFPVQDESTAIENGMAMDLSIFKLVPVDPGTDGGGYLIIDQYGKVEFRDSQFMEADQNSGGAYELQVEAIQVPPYQLKITNRNSGIVDIFEITRQDEQSPFNIKLVQNDVPIAPDPNLGASSLQEPLIPDAGIDQTEAVNATVEPESTAAAPTVANTPTITPTPTPEPSAEPSSPTAEATDPGISSPATSNYVPSTIEAAGTEPTSMAPLQPTNTSTPTPSVALTEQPNVETPMPSSESTISATVEAINTAAEAVSTATETPTATLEPTPIPSATSGQPLQTSGDFGNLQLTDEPDITSTPSLTSTPVPTVVSGQAEQNSGIVSGLEVETTNEPSVTPAAVTVIPTNTPTNTPVPTNTPSTTPTATPTSTPTSTLEAIEKATDAVQAAVSETPSTTITETPQAVTATPTPSYTPSPTPTSTPFNVAPADLTNDTGAEPQITNLQTGTTQTPPVPYDEDRFPEALPSDTTRPNPSIGIPELPVSQVASGVVGVAKSAGDVVNQASQSAQDAIQSATSIIDRLAESQTNNDLPVPSADPLAAQVSEVSSDEINSLPPSSEDMPPANLGVGPLPSPYLAIEESDGATSARQPDGTLIQSNITETTRPLTQPEPTETIEGVVEPLNVESPRDESLDSRETEIPDSPVTSVQPQDPMGRNAQVAQANADNFTPGAQITNTLESISFADGLYMRSFTVKLENQSEGVSLVPLLFRQPGSSTDNTIANNLNQVNIRVDYGNAADPFGQELLTSLNSYLAYNQSGTPVGFVFNQEIKDFDLANPKWDSLVIFDSTRTVEGSISLSGKEMTYRIFRFQMQPATQTEPLEGKFVTALIDGVWTVVDIDLVNSKGENIYSGDLGSYKSLADSIEADAQTALQAPNPITPDIGATFVPDNPEPPTEQPVSTTPEQTTLNAAPPNLTNQIGATGPIAETNLSPYTANPIAGVGNIEEGQEVNATPDAPLFPNTNINPPDMSVDETPLKNTTTPISSTGGNKLLPALPGDVIRPIKDPMQRNIDVANANLNNFPLKGLEPTPEIVEGRFGESVSGQLSLDATGTLVKFEDGEPHKVFSNLGFFTIDLDTPNLTDLGVLRPVINSDRIIVGFVYSAGETENLTSPSWDNLVLLNNPLVLPKFIEFGGRTERYKLIEFNLDPENFAGNEKGEGILLLEAGEWKLVSLRFIDENAGQQKVTELINAEGVYSQIVSDIYAQKAQSMQGVEIETSTITPAPDTAFNSAKDDLLQAAIQLESENPSESTKISIKTLIQSFTDDYFEPSLMELMNLKDPGRSAEVGVTLIGIFNEIVENDLLTYQQRSELISTMTNRGEFFTLPLSFVGYDENTQFVAYNFQNPGQSLNIRSLPTTASESVITTIPHNTDIEIKAVIYEYNFDESKETQTNVRAAWYLVEYGGKTGFINGSVVGER